MRRRRTLQGVRLAHAAVGATVIAAPASAAALAEAATTQTAAAPRSDSPMSAKLRARRIVYGKDVVVTGRAPAGQAGQTVTLQYAARGSSTWQSMASSPVHADGGFRLAAPLRRSGAVRVTGSWQPQQPAAVAAGGDSATTATAPESVTVAAALRLPRRTLRSFGSGSQHVRGRLLPGAAGRRVKLQVLRSGRWHTVARDRTGRHGRFDLVFSVPFAGRDRLRVVFAGDSANGATRHAAGTVAAFTPSVASWYEDGGNTACGFHAYYGVASPSLPCGTHVTFSYHGRTVTATVDDRGPFVGGRQWDLNQNTAGALGFAGVDTVWYSE